MLVPFLSSVAPDRLQENWAEIDKDEAKKIQRSSKKYRFPAATDDRGRKRTQSIKKKIVEREGKWQKRDDDETK